MTTARVVVNLALRKLGVLGSGRDARPTDAADALAALQGLYGSWIATGAFGRLHDRVPVGTQYVAQGNERIMRQDASDIEIILPELVSSGWHDDYGHNHVCYYGTVVTGITVNGETVWEARARQQVGYIQSPRDGTAVVISDSVTGNILTWLYDGTLKTWQQIELLQMDNEAPRSTADLQGLAACLAMEIADQFGAQLSEVTVTQASRYKMQMTHRFGMRREPVPGVYI